MQKCLRRNGQWQKTWLVRTTANSVESIGLNDTIAISDLKCVTLCFRPNLNNYSVMRLWINWRFFTFVPFGRHDGPEWFARIQFLSYFSELGLQNCRFSCYQPLKDGSLSRAYLLWNWTWALSIYSLTERKFAVYGVPTTSIPQTQH